jgi:hypothetical protein
MWVNRENGNHHWIALVEIIEMDMWTQIRLRMRELWPTQDEVLQLIDSVKNVSDSRG